MGQDRVQTIHFPYLFLLLNLVLVGALYAILIHSVERAVGASITRSTEAGNVAITRVFVNEVYPELHRYLGLSGNVLESREMLEQEELAAVDQRVRDFMLGTDILKAKIYNLNGTTLYSSDLSQVGSSVSDLPGFTSAVRGSPVSEVIHRGVFSSLDGEVFDRDMVASYVPIRHKSGEIIGVAEIYTDRSEVVRYSDDLIVGVKSELVPLLVAILLAIAMIIWRFTDYANRLQINYQECNRGESPLDERD